MNSFLKIWNSDCIHHRIHTRVEQNEQASNYGENKLLTLKIKVKLVTEMDWAKNIHLGITLIKREKLSNIPLLVQSMDRADLLWNNSYPPIGNSDTNQYMGCCIQ